MVRKNLGLGGLLRLALSFLPAGQTLRRGITGCDAHQELYLPAHGFLGMTAALAHPPELLITLLEQLALGHFGQLDKVGQDSHL